MSINRELFEKIKAHIREEPRRLHMEWWIKRDKQSPCGTAACIGGWAALLSGKTLTSNFYNVAKKALRIPMSDDDDWIFEVAAWPEDLRSRYKNAETPAERAEAACEAIDRFVQENAA